MGNANVAGKASQRVVERFRGLAEFLEKCSGSEHRTGFVTADYDRVLDDSYVEDKFNGEVVVIYR